MSAITHLTSFCETCFQKSKDFICLIKEGIAKRIGIVFEKSKFTGNPQNESSSSRALYIFNPKFSQKEMQILESLGYERPSLANEYLKHYTKQSNCSDKEDQILNYLKFNGNTVFAKKVKSPLDEILVNEQKCSTSLQESIRLFDMMLKSEALDTNKAVQSDLRTIRDDYHLAYFQSKQLSRELDYVLMQEKSTSNEKIVEIAKIYQSENFENYCNALASCVRNLESGKIFIAGKIFIEHQSQSDSDILKIKLHLNKETIAPAKAFPAHEAALIRLKNSVKEGAQSLQTILEVLERLENLKHLFQ